MEAQTEETINRWNLDYVLELKRVLELEDSNLDTLARCVYNFGVLDHISPKNPDIFKARIETKRDVFKRDDPDLYAAIVYSSLNLINSRPSDTIFAGFVPGPVLQAVFNENMSAKKREQLFGNDEEPQATLARKIVELAENDYKRISGTDLRIFKIGEIVTIKGTEAVISGYSHDGKIILSPNIPERDLGYEDRRVLIAKAGTADGELMSDRKTYSQLMGIISDKPQI